MGRPVDKRSWRQVLRFLPNVVGAKIDTYHRQGMMIGGIVGGNRPSRYSRSPDVWEDYFRRVSCRAVFLPLDLDPGPAPQPLLARPWGGRRTEHPGLVAFLHAFLSDSGVYELTVTDPYKNDAYFFALDEGARIMRSAANVGRVNHLVRARNGGILALNTDGAGMLLALSSEVDIDGASVLLFGAGGAATAIAHALVSGGAKKLVVLNRSEGKARDLCERLPMLRRVDAVHGGLEEASRQLCEVDVVVDATTVGILQTLKTTIRGSGGPVVVSTRYGAENDFARWASERSLRFMDGLSMVFWQFVCALPTVMEHSFLMEVDWSALQSCGSGFGVLPRHWERVWPLSRELSLEGV